MVYRMMLKFLIDVDVEAAVVEAILRHHVDVAGDGSRAMHDGVRAETYLKSLDVAKENGVKPYAITNVGT